jgi:hypothetical protein
MPAVVNIFVSKAEIHSIKKSESPRQADPFFNIIFRENMPKEDPRSN